MRVLVLGAGGFIGTNLCRALREAGHEVTAFGRHKPFAEAHEGIPWHFAHFSDTSALRRALDGQEVVFDLIGSGLPDPSNRAPSADVTASVFATVNLLDACREAKLRRVVFASSGGTVYGIARTPSIEETHPTEPISAYGIGKLTVEKYLGLYAYLHDLDYTILRIGNPYGPYQTGARSQGLVGALALRALRGEAIDIWGDGGIIRDFIHIDDVTRAAIAALAPQAARRIYNVGSGVGRSVDEVLSAILAESGGAVAERRYLPGRKADVPRNVLSIARIGDELGWRPRVEWQQGLGSTIAWLRAHLPVSVERRG